MIHRHVVPHAETLSLLSEHSFPRHSHDQFGIGIFMHGSQRSWSNLGNVEASVGDTIMVNPGEIHDGIPAWGLRGWHMLYVSPEIIAHELRECLPAGNLTLKPVVHDPVLSRTMGELFRELGTANPDPLAIEELMMVSLMHASQFHVLSVAPRKVLSPLVTRAKQVMDDIPGENVTLSELAALCATSRFQLIRGFAREMGITPHAYLLQSRVRLAKKLLAQGDKTVDVALNAGFSDQSHLTHAFLRQTGVTPGQYRSSMR